LSTLTTEDSLPVSSSSTSTTKWLLLVAVLLARTAYFSHPLWCGRDVIFILRSRTYLMLFVHSVHKGECLASETSQLFIKT
jgi:hypothetical protein